jgi:putative transposase
MMLKAYKYRIYPNKDQTVLLAKHFGCARYIYNYGLEQKIKAYSETKKSISRFVIQSDLPKLKKAEETKWLSEVNSLSLQAALLNLDMAFTRFFKEKKGFPKFKSKHDNNQSFQVPQNTGVDYEAKRVYLPKFKEGIKCKFNRQFKGKIKTSTVSKTPTGKYFISILVETEDTIPSKAPIDENKAVGVDLGIKTFATLSDGTEIQNPKYLKKALKKLKRLQRSISRKKKGSNSRNKAVKLLARQYENVANKRRDFLHKTSKYLIDHYDTVCLETLSANNMVKNHRLAQALSDISIGTFNAYMNYKAEWYGKNIIRIGRFEPSSKMCSCGYVYRGLKLSDRVWICPDCGAVNQRDLLAANNIKKFAFKLNNTAGTVGIYAKESMNPIRSAALETLHTDVVETHASLACW